MPKGPKMLCLALFLAGCSDCEGVRQGPPATSDQRDGGRPGSAPDGSVFEDAGLGPDAGSSWDLGVSLDVGSQIDGGASTDAGETADGGALADAGESWDGATIQDAGESPDIGFLIDAGGPGDTGLAPDTGSFPDAGTPGTGEVWIELDYRSAYSPESPSWSFSPTPGWGAQQWAASNASYPEAWDRWNNMTVGSDPIGTALLIGSSSELQLMIGLEEMLSYGRVLVRLEGRSRSTSSSAQFDVYNPLNGCGVSASMSNDWTPDLVELDLGQCLLTGSGGGIEAIRVDPTNGAVALLRMRVTLESAVW